MNRVFQVIYNEVRGKYMVCDENCHTHSKPKSAKTMVAAAIVGLSMLSAGSVLADVVSGNLEVTGSLTVDGNILVDSPGTTITTPNLVVTTQAKIEKLEVTSTAELKGGLKVEGAGGTKNVVVDAVTGDTTVGGKLTVKDETTLEKNATLKGAINTIGNGDGSSTNTIYGTTNVTGAFNANGNNTIGNGDGSSTNTIYGTTNKVQSGENSVVVDANGTQVTGAFNANGNNTIGNGDGSSTNTIQGTVNTMKSEAAGSSIVNGPIGNAMVTETGFNMLMAGEDSIVNGAKLKYVGADGELHDSTGNVMQAGTNAIVNDAEAGTAIVTNKGNNAIVSYNGSNEIIAQNNTMTAAQSNTIQAGTVSPDGNGDALNTLTVNAQTADEGIVVNSLGAKTGVKVDGKGTNAGIVMSAESTGDGSTAMTLSGTDSTGKAQAVLSGTKASVLAGTQNGGLNRGLVVNANPDGSGYTALTGGGTSDSGAAGVYLAGAHAGLVNNTGNGMYAGPTQTVMRGGASNPTSLTLNDSGARFSNSRGGAVRVSGIKAGTHDSDAVNYHQFSHAMAQASAIAGVPMVDYGKSFGIGGAVGMYGDAQAVAFGASARFLENWTVKGALSYTEGPTNKLMGNVGVGYSW